jgi:hypothetical protein
LHLDDCDHQAVDLGMIHLRSYLALKRLQ